MKPWLALGLLLSLGGCPRNVNVPDPPSEATKCTSEIQCNDVADGGTPCGYVRACVEGHCEGQASRVVPCVD
jgi:hypothetical protein